MTKMTASTHKSFNSDLNIVIRAFVADPTHRTPMALARAVATAMVRQGWDFVVEFAEVEIVSGLFESEPAADTFARCFVWQHGMSI